MEAHRVITEEFFRSNLDMNRRKPVETSVERGDARIPPARRRSITGREDAHVLRADIQRSRRRW
jgi:hypothetical protein